LNGYRDTCSKISEKFAFACVEGCAGSCNKISGESRSILERYGSEGK